VGNHGIDENIQTSKWIGGNQDGGMAESSGFSKREAEDTVHNVTNGQREWGKAASNALIRGKGHSLSSENRCNKEGKTRTRNENIE